MILHSVCDAVANLCHCTESAMHNFNKIFNFCTLKGRFFDFLIITGI